MSLEEEPTTDDHLVEGIDFYREGGYVVFTAAWLTKRGYCCESGCRHCPWGFSCEVRWDTPRIGD